MKIQLLSDLHLEFADYLPLQLGADVVVLAGDVHTKGRGVAWALKHFEVPVVYVPGNHEYYSGSLGRTLDKMRKAAAGTHVHVLDRNVVELAGVRFIGATLWTDYRLTGNQPLAEWDARQNLQDFRLIRDEHFTKVRPEGILQRHAKDRFFIEEQLNTPFEGKTVVVSHHAPCELSITERFRRDAKNVHLNASYASRLDHLLGADRVALWVHGHTHDSLDYEVYGTRVVCNPRGYAPKDTNPDFQPSLLLDV